MTRLTDPILDRYLDEQRVFNAQLRDTGKTVPNAGLVDVKTLRAHRLYNADGTLKPPQDAQAEDSSVDAAGTSVPIRIFKVANPDGLYIHFHGGGFALGSIYEQDPFLRDFSDQTNTTLVTVGYPLAPESGLLDSLQTASRALAAILDQYEGMRACVGAESAGANVALNSVLRIRNSRPDAFSRIVAMSLSYGLFDLSMTPSQRHWGEAFLNLSTPYLEWFYSLCLPDWSRDERSHPDISPLYADLHDLPPTLFSVGLLDPLRDDTLFLYERFRAEGLEAVLKAYPEAPHGFNGLPTEMAKHCNQTSCEFLRTKLIKTSDSKN